MKWLVVALLWFVGCLNYIDRQAIFSVFPLLRKELAMSDIELALLGSAFLWAYGLSSPLCGVLGDRFRRKNIILWSLGVFSLVTLVAGLADSGRQLVWLRTFLGVSEALYIPAALAMIADCHSERTRSTAVGIHQTSLLAGSIIGGVLAGYLGDRYGWRPAFSFLGGSGLLLCAVLYFSLPSPPAVSRAAPSGRGFPGIPVEIFRRPTFLCVLFGGASLSMVSWVVTAWMPVYLHDHFKLNLAQAGLNAVLYASIATMAGLLAGGALADLWARRDDRARMFVQLAGLAVSAPAVLGVGHSASLAPLLAYLFVFGFGRGLYECNNMPLISQVVGPDQRATAYGVFNLTNTLAAGASVLVTGALKQSLGIAATISAMSGALALASLVTLAGAVWFLRRDRARAPGGNRLS